MNSVFQPSQGMAQSGTKMLIAGDNLAKLLQAGNFCDEAQQANFGGGFRGKLDLLEKLGSEASGGEPGHDEHHGVTHWGAPLDVGFRHQSLDGNDFVDDPLRHGVAQRLAGGAA